MLSYFSKGFNTQKQQEEVKANFISFVFFFFLRNCWMVGWLVLLWRSHHLIVHFYISWVGVCMYFWCCCCVVLYCYCYCCYCCFQFFTSSTCHVVVYVRVGKLYNFNNEHILKSIIKVKYIIYEMKYFWPFE